MLKRPAPEQTALEMVTLDQLVPADHLLRKIDRVIDFSFIHDLTASLYCADNGRPPLDPTLMFKALFVGYLFGVRSERQLVREIEVNVAYRWFLRPAADGYRCPQGQLLAYATTDRTGYRHYRSDPAICRTCPLLASCTTSANATRLITRHVWQDARERNDATRLTAWGKAIYRRRKETVERSFADAKQLFGHRYARFRSLTRVRVQCLLAAAAQNIKKIALCLWPKPKVMPA